MMVAMKRFESTSSACATLATGILSEVLNRSEASASVAYATTAAQQKQAPVKHGFGAGGAKKKTKLGEDGMNPKLQQVVEMLLPSDQQAGPGGIPARDNAGEFEQKEKAYLAKKRAMQATWEHDMRIKHLVQRAALRALPPELRAKAEEPDLGEFPHDRQLLFETAPESYRSRSRDAEAPKPKEKPKEKK
jgi:hypothetical protein